MREKFRRDLKFSTHKMVMMAIMLALTCSSVYLPAIQFSSTLAVTYQSFFAVLNGLLCGAVYGAAVQVIYLFMGLVGIPVFSNGGSGFASVLKPSFGFLIGFIFASFVAGLLMNYFSSCKPWHVALVSVISTLCIYPFGMSYMVIAQINFLSIAPAVAWASLYTIPLFLLGDGICLIIIVLLPMKLLRRYALENRHLRHQKPLVNQAINGDVILADVTQSDLVNQTATDEALLPDVTQSDEENKNIQ